MSYSRNKRVVLSIGVFLVLSLVVFGSIFCVAYSAVNTQIIASGDDTGSGVDGQEREPMLVGGSIKVVPSSDYIRLHPTTHMWPIARPY